MGSATSLTVSDAVRERLAVIACDRNRSRNTSARPDRAAGGRWSRHQRHHAPASPRLASGAATALRRGGCCRAAARRPQGPPGPRLACPHRSEEHTSELQSLLRISYAVFCLKRKKSTETQTCTLN